MMISGKYSLSPSLFSWLAHVFFSLLPQGPAVDMWSLGVACCKFPGILWMGILHKGHGYRMIQHNTTCCLARCSSLRVLDWAAGLILQKKSMFFRCGNAGAIKVDAAAKGWWQKEALAWQERSLSTCQYAVVIPETTTGFSHNMRNQSYKIFMAPWLPLSIHGIRTMNQGLCREEAREVHSAEKAWLLRAGPCSVFGALENVDDHNMRSTRWNVNNYMPECSQGLKFDTGGFRWV